MAANLLRGGEVRLPVLWRARVLSLPLAAGAYQLRCSSDASNNPSARTEIPSGRKALVDLPSVTVTDSLRGIPVQVTQEEKSPRNVNTALTDLRTGPKPNPSGLSHSVATDEPGKTEGRWRKREELLNQVLSWLGKQTRALGRGQCKKV